MYTLYQSVSRIPLPTSLTLGHLPPGGRVVGRENKSPTHREMAIYWPERSRKSMGVNFSLPNRSMNRWHLIKNA